MSLQHPRTGSSSASFSFVTDFFEELLATLDNSILN